ncbi:AraC family transcriptional regulator [Methylobacterium sp. 092160098-2]|uniref:AraC family transcriptional regulator n=1 Tax=Methylobacterium sp. 092160098-2 TaxID=3025129 RepID=UPI002381CB3C|nr:AraC family transcriptional regulator [Methylobacterium sp. 092160098-2]MDE4915157.1 AraC family transcriptional regulator [Methylobacterium sp. 092160098-2]
MDLSKREAAAAAIWSKTLSLTTDWLSRLLAMVAVSGRLDIHCVYQAPWRIEQPQSETGAMPYHAIIAGSAILEDPKVGKRRHLKAGDIVLIPHGGAHVLHDGSGAPAIPSSIRQGRNLLISENTGTGQRLDMLCGHIILASPEDRLIREYLPENLVVRSVEPNREAPEKALISELTSLVSLMRLEAASDSLGGRAMLNALSAAMFTLTLRSASQAQDSPVGLLALAANPRLAPALSAILHEPSKAWTLPKLAKLCNMSRATAARQFQEKLGRSANDLLSDIRMTMAAHELRKPLATIGTVADLVGYQSEAAFQRAFKQHIGLTPAVWRRQNLPSQPLALMFGDGAAQHNLSP